MDTKQLMTLLNSSEVTQPYFLNVYALDQLPKHRITESKWLLIANSCPSNRAGLHWLAIFKTNDNSIEVFDSYGGDPTVYDLIPFLRAQTVTKCQYNATRLQALDSQVCGHYCLYYAYWRCRRKTMHDIIDSFSNINYARNDTRVYNHVIKLFDINK